MKEIKIIRNIFIHHVLDLHSDMTKFNEKTLSKLKTADKLFDEKYGKKGTKSREEFEIKSRAWYMKAIKTKN